MATLLVVDDEQDIRDLVVQRMVRDGHEVLAADSGPSALDLIRECGLPDAAILDVDMPGMDGFDVLRELRRRAGRPAGAPADRAVGVEAAEPGARGRGGRASASRSPPPARTGVQTLLDGDP